MSKDFAIKMHEGAAKQIWVFTLDGLYIANLLVAVKP
jgi:hypothetical protein